MTDKSTPTPAHPRTVSPNGGAVAPAPTIASGDANTNASPSSSALSGRRFEDWLAGILENVASHDCNDDDCVGKNVTLSPSRSKLVEEVIRAARTLSDKMHEWAVEDLTLYAKTMGRADLEEVTRADDAFRKSVRALDASLDSGGEGDE